MKIAIGSDHRGFQMKKTLSDILRKSGHSVEDVGAFDEAPSDYPEIALKVGEAMSRGRAERGILACKSGIGMSIAANKIRGVRAALCHGVESARLSRQHNDANVLVLAADELSAPAEVIVQEWLAAPFEGGRHQRRVEIIDRIEKENFK